MFGLSLRICSLRLAPLRLGIALVIVSASICAADEAFVLQQQAIKRIDGNLDDYRKTGDPASLLPDLERADADLATSYHEFIRRGNLEAAALSLIKRGDISRYRGLNDLQQPKHWQQAIDFYQQAHDLAQQANHLPHQAEALIRLAQAEAGRRDYGAAAAHIEKALDVSARISDKKYLSNSLDQLAFIQSHRGELVAAAETRSRALTVAEAMHDNMRLFYGHDGRAGVYEDLGAKRCDYWEVAREVAEQGVEQPREVAEQLREVDLAYQKAFERCYEALQLAQTDYERALELARKLGALGLEKMTQESLQRVEQRRKVALEVEISLRWVQARGYEELGANALQLAQAAYERVLELARKLGASSWEKMTQESLQRVQRKEKKRWESADKDHQAPAVAEIMQEDMRLFYGPDGRVLVHEQFIRDRLALPAEVVKQTQDGVALGRGDAWGFHLQGVLLEEQGKNDAALAAYLKAVAVLEADRGTLRDEQSRGTFLEDKISLYYRPILHLLERRQLGEAFELLERSKSRALADLLTSKPLTLERSIDRELYAALRKAEANISLRQQELLELYTERRKAEVSSAPQVEADRMRAAERIASKEQEIQRLEEPHQRLLDRIAKEAPQLHRLMAATPASLQQLQYSMRQDGYEVLQYLVLESSLIVWHISGDAVQVKSVYLPRSQLIQKMKHLQKSLRDRHELFAEQKARELFLFLIQPVLSGIRSEHLVIIPHDALYSIPFQVLQNPSDKKYLGEQFRISYAPSATILLGLNMAGSIAGQKLLVVADPKIRPARREVTAIARWYPDRHRVVSDVLVTKAALKALVAHYDLLHLSVHGVFTPQEPLLSHLNLAEDGPDDGKLTAAEMFGLPLEQSRLVVLSACETGQAEVTQANEILGMIRALLYAGANTLMLSSWKVEAASTARWMEVFYQEAQTQSLSEAARRALREVKNDPKHPEYRHPYYWGPFLMIGK